MNNKIKNYIDVLFFEIPRSKKANDLKEELLSNMSERFEDYIKDGKTENQAYSLVIGNLGDIDEMLADVMPSDDFVKEAYSFRNRNAKSIAIGVFMYIIGGAFLIGLGGYGLFSNNLATYGLAALITLLVFAAIATGIIIYTNMSTPLEYKDFNRKSKKEMENMYHNHTMDSKHARLLNNITTIYWIIATVIYLAISFKTFAWGITWIIMVIAAVGHFAIGLIFDMKYSDK